MANKEFLDTRHDSELCRMRLYVTYSVSSETQTAITYSVSALAQVKSSTAGSVIRGDNSASWGMAISDSGGFYGGNRVTWDQVSAKNVTCSSANTWYTVYTFSAKSITIQKGSTTQSLLLYAPLDALINSGTYPKAYLDYDGSAIVSGIAKISYTVSYNANGGSGAPANQTKVYGEALKLSSTVPTKSGWTFAGWATSSSSSSVAYAAGASYTGNAALALYAVWKRVITVGYNANGGTNAPANQQVTIYNSATSGNITITTARPSRGNFAFLGWAGSSTATTAAYNPGSSYSFSSDTVLYAVWDAAPTINSLTVVRSDSNGDPADEGTYALVTCEWYLDGTLGDTATLSGTITPQSGGNATSFTFDTGGSGSGSVTATALISGVDPDMQYTVLVTAVNGNNTSKRSTILTRAFFVMDWKAGGQAVGIGRAAPANGLEVGYETVFDDDVTVLGDVDVNGVIHSDGNVYIDNKTKGYYVIDQADVTYPAVYDNGKNLWVGAESGAGPHHTGALCLSTGYTGTGGNKTFSACVPNADNTGGTFYDVFHTGYLDVSKATDGNLPISHGGTNASDRLNGFRNIAFLGWNPTGGSANDTRAKWASLGTGFAFINATGQLNNQPGQYGILINFIESAEIHQIWLTQANGKMLQRGGNGSTTAMGTWYSPHTADCLYNNATGTDGSVGLSASAANYNHMRIYFKKNGDSNARGSTDLISPNGNRASLVVGNYSSPTIQIAWKTVTISGTSISVYSQGHMIENTNNGSWGAGASDAKVYIYRVEAWNEWN